MLDASMTLRRGDFTLEVDLHAGRGEVLAIVGPNGSGKTTLLRALAGLDPLDTGHVMVDGKPWDDVERGLHLETADRGTALVLAEPLLFPHMTVTRNVGFGLSARGASKAEGRATALRLLESIGMGEYGERRPATLSTGQQQRISLLRALAVEPQLLLLDEPLSAQDPATRAALRAELGRLLASFDGVAILVTHDAIDALTLADRVMVMDDGRIVQQGTPDTLIRRPESTFVAELVGLNLLRGVASGHGVSVEGGGSLQLAEPTDGPVLLSFPPHALTVSNGHEDATESSSRNKWRATVGEIQPFYGRVRLTLSGPPNVVAEVTAAAVAELGLTAGTPVMVSLKATEIEVSPA